jgi:hypothetical protein
MSDAMNNINVEIKVFQPREGRRNWLCYIDGGFDVEMCEGNGRTADEAKSKALDELEEWYRVIGELLINNGRMVSSAEGRKAGS